MAFWARMWARVGRRRFFLVTPRSGRGKAEYVGTIIHKPADILLVTQWSGIGGWNDIYN